VGRVVAVLPGVALEPGHVLAQLLDLVAARDPVEHLVADVVDELHGRQVLVGGVRRTVVAAARALGARVGVEQRLPRELLELAHAPLGLVLEVELGQVHPALAAVAERDVGQRAEQVDVLGVGQVVEERQDDQHVQPVGRRGRDRRAARWQRRQAMADGIRQRHPRGAAAAGRELAGDVQAVEQEVRDHQRADRAEDERGVEAHRDERRLDEHAARDGPQHHEQDDGVHHVDRAVQRLVEEAREQLERHAGDDAADDDVGGRDRDDQEAPEDEQVVLAGAVERAFFGDLLLREEVHADVDQPADLVIGARPGIRRAHGDRAAEQPRRPHEEGQAGRQQDDEDQRIHGGFRSGV
jgi:hypothetical protein